MDSSNLLRRIGKVPDLNENWQEKIDTFEKRRLELEGTSHAIGEAYHALRNMVDRAIGEVRACHGYSHIRSFTAMLRPEEFSTWILKIDSIADVEEMKKTWKLESIYSVAEPVEKSLDLLSMALTALACFANTRSRQRQSAWSVRENHQAAVVDTRWQTKFIGGLLANYLEPFLKIMDALMTEHTEDTTQLDRSEVTAFEAADEDGRFRIIEPKWREVTGYTNPAVWEQTWHYQKMKELRTMMRMHMMSSVEEVYGKVKDSIQQLHDVMIQ